MAPCKLPPPGWYCTREEGHEGPCAAKPYPLITSTPIPQPGDRLSADDAELLVNGSLAALRTLADEVDVLREDAAAGAPFPPGALSTTFRAIAHKVRLACADLEARPRPQAAEAPEAQAPAPNPTKAAYAEADPYANARAKMGETKWHDIRDGYFEGFRSGHRKGFREGWAEGVADKPEERAEALAAAKEEGRREALAEVQEAERESYWRGSCEGLVTGLRRAQSAVEKQAAAELGAAQAHEANAKLALARHALLTAAHAAIGRDADDAQAAAEGRAKQADPTTCGAPLSSGRRCTLRWGHTAECFARRGAPEQGQELPPLALSDDEREQLALLAVGEAGHIERCWPAESERIAKLRTLAARLRGQAKGGEG